MPSTRTQNLNIFSWNTFVLVNPCCPQKLECVCVGGRGRVGVGVYPVA